ncbi:MAG: carboxypeptidase-like regulatory domain-containing protein [Acidobacteria bacterium]|nr:carboxypeptidase-like regulatory domain-containing protein [Acidobacteriota bacterium]
MRPIALRLVVSLLSLLLAAPLAAQTATTASMSGRVTDAQGAVIPGATVKLTDRSTAQARTAVSDSQGRYAFFTLPPGVYDLSVTLVGFKTATVAGLIIEATRPAVQNVGLTLGGITEEVTVNATSETLVIKRDSSVGNTIERQRLMLLPNLTRDAASLLALQPGVSSTGFVTGARQDQTTYAIDGIDISDNVIGATFRTAVPTPAESVEEFRMTVANPNATFGRSSGAQVSFVTRRGTNKFDGSAYTYLQDDKWNATPWHTNRLGQPKPPLEDRRYGGSLGGPLVKGKTFFFGLFEARRDRGTTTVTRLVPTATLKQGILQFRDASGTVQTINPRDLDPRGIGANPLILQMLSLYPEPNNLTAAGADGLNTGGFTFDVATPIDDNQGIFRLDHTFNSNWRLDSSVNVSDRKTLNAAQTDIVNRVATYNVPTKGRAVSVGLLGVLRSNLTNEFRVGYVKDDRGAIPIDPAPQVPGLNIAIDLAGANLSEPIDVGTQNARKQLFPLQTYQIIDNLTWLKGSHSVQSGFNFRLMHEEDFRNDKVVGSLSVPVAQVGSAQFNLVPAAQRPGFIAATDVARYDALYAALLGQVDSSAYLATRDGSLQPNPIGTGLISQSDLNAYEFYAADTWQVKPTFTVNYGVTYNWQTPPTEKDGRQTLLTFHDTGELVSAQQYLADKRAAAERGEIYNPTLAYVPIRESGRTHAFDTDYTNVSPRVSAAWTPSFTKGWANRLFGDGKTVIRGGYSLLYDRSTTVQTITIPTLGVGFAQTLSVNAPQRGPGDPFRVGDGPIPLAVNRARAGIRRAAVVCRRSGHHGPAQPHSQSHAAARASRQHGRRAGLHRTLRTEPVSERESEPGALHVQGSCVGADLRAGIRRRGRRTACEPRRRCERHSPAVVREPAARPGPGRCEDAGARCEQHRKHYQRQLEQPVPVRHGFLRGEVVQQPAGARAVHADLAGPVELQRLFHDGSQALLGRTRLRRQLHLVEIARSGRCRAEQRRTSAELLRCRLRVRAVV